MASDSRRWIVDALAERARDRGLTPEQRGWVPYLFYFAHVQHAVSILRLGRIYSRNQASHRGLIQIEAADSAVIAQSRRAWDFARLYFAPRTPTQYCNEGIRPPDERVNYHGAHCPVPVFFLFDSAALLSHPDCHYTDGSLAYGDTDILRDPSILRSLDFRLIYHRESYDPTDWNRARRIKNARHTEILFQDELPLDHLVSIVCRTGAERDMLLYYLGADLARRWKTRIRLERPGENFFERRWCYIKEARLADQAVWISSSFLTRRAERTITVTMSDGRIFEKQLAPTTSTNPEGFRLPSNEQEILLKYTVYDCTAFEGVVAAPTLVHS